MWRRNWLIDARKEKGFTQKQVSEQTGINRTTVTKAELGYDLSFNTANKLANLFGMNWTRFYENRFTDNHEFTK